MVKLLTGYAKSVAMRMGVLWHWLRSSFWFVPSVMVIAAGLLSQITIMADRALSGRERLTGLWVYTGNIEGAREILSSLAGSMITVAGVVFSITIVVLSLASSQFGPRLIWNFMHDIGNQIVLGTFISTFLFCLLLLGRIREDGGSAFAPQLSITTSIILSMASLGVLIYFIHHISSSIHASSVAAAVWRDLKESIARFYPEKTELDGRESGLDIEPRFPESADTVVCPVPALKSGYLEAINPEGLLRIATERDLVLRLNYRPGHFIVRGGCLALVSPGNRVDASLVEEINRTFIVGAQRTLEQDVEFSVHQLVEIAVRALSPGVNDPYTAMTCVDWLGAALCDFLERKHSCPYGYDGDKKLRVISIPFTFPGLMDAAFNEIRQYGRASVSVTIRLLETLAVLAARVRKSEDMDSVRRHAWMIKRGSEQAICEQEDRNDVDDRFQRVMDALINSGSDAGYQ